MITVDMDGQFCRAEQPDGLTTEGVSTCIAVSIADDKDGVAWLIHASCFGHEISSLDEMLTEATKRHKKVIGLRILIVGGASANVEGGKIEAELAKRAVMEKVHELAPLADNRCQWLEDGEALNVEVLFDNNRWDISCRDGWA